MRKPDSEYHFHCIGTSDVFSDESHTGQFVDWCVKFVISWEKLGSSWEDQTVRLSNGHIGHARYVPDFCPREKEKCNLIC